VANWVGFVERLDQADKAVRQKTKTQIDFSPVTVL
jgi:hypothetical protein